MINWRRFDTEYVRRGRFIYLLREIISRDNGRRFDSNSGCLMINWSSLTEMFAGFGVPVVTYDDGEMK